MSESKLLLLPAEIRTTIYNHIILEAWVGIHIRTTPTDESSQKLAFVPGQEYHQSYPVLFICKTIYTEVLPLFVASIRIRFGYIVLPRELSVPIQHNYLCHIRKIQVYYEETIPYDPTAFDSLQELYLRSDYEIASHETCCLLQWPEGFTEEALIGLLDQYDQSNDSRLNRYARDGLLEEGTWVADMYMDPNRSFKMFDCIIAKVHFGGEEELFMFITYDMDTLETTEMDRHW